MTAIEQRTMEAVQSINRKMRDQKSVDWEQRRYEIARDILPYCSETSKQVLLSGGKLDTEGDTFADKVATQAVMFADALISKLLK
jgi:hypothetical protein